MKILVNLLLGIVFLSSTVSFAQWQEFSYQRKIEGVNSQWHSLQLPKEIYGKLLPSLNDLRIMGITKTGDTSEVPYLVYEKEDKITNKRVEFTQLNSSKNAQGYYFTFEIPTMESINEIELNFDQDNFDWKLTLEGSQNQNEWFTVTENYRILSVKNESTHFEFTTVKFPEAKFRYVRIRIESEIQPKLILASIFKKEKEKGNYENYEVVRMAVIENKEFKQTEINVEMDWEVPINEIGIQIKDSLDYFRPVTIEYLVDSFETEKGWKYNYRSLTSGNVNSWEENIFTIGKTNLKNIRIIIQNGDNQSLSISSVSVRGYVTQLKARFGGAQSYYLIYGNNRVSRPNYDLNRFSANIPNELEQVQLSTETVIEKKEIEKVAPIFENKLWLWAVIIGLIAIMGGFTLKMMNKK